MWRKDDQLIVFHNTQFPDRCVKCNAPANGLRLKRMVYWQPPVHGGLGAVIIKAGWMAVVRKKAKLNIGICPKHLRRRHQAIVIGLTGVAAGMLLMVFGATWFHSGYTELSGFTIFAGSALYGGIVGPVIFLTMTKDGLVFIDGVGRDFLAGLPKLARIK